MTFAYGNPYTSDTCWIMKAITQDIPLYCYTDKNSLLFFSRERFRERKLANTYKVCMLTTKKASVFYMQDFS